MLVPKNWQSTPQCTNEQRHTGSAKSKVWRPFAGYHSICGVIKQNQSEVGQIQIHFSNYLYAPFLQLHFAENPIEIGQLVPKI